MAETEQHLEHEQKTSQHLKKSDDAQQQQQLNSAAKNFETNNSSTLRNAPEDDRKIYLGGLKEEITKKDLSEHFGQFGEIKYVDIKVNAATGRSRGYAFVVFKTIRGIDNALACNNHVINNMKIEPKKAIPRRIKLFIGGLTSILTDEDIIEYIKRYTHRAIVEMPLNPTNLKRKGFCFVTIENLEAVTEILRRPRHVIKEKEVEIKVAETRSMGYGMIRGASRSMIPWQTNVMGQGGFLRHPGYYAPGYYYGGYGYYVPYTGYYPTYLYSCDYPSYFAGAEAGY